MLPPEHNPDFNPNINPKCHPNPHPQPNRLRRLHPPPHQKKYSLFQPIFIPLLGGTKWYTGPLRGLNLTSYLILKSHSDPHPQPNRRSRLRPSHSSSTPFSGWPQITTPRASPWERNPVSFYRHSHCKRRGNVIRELQIQHPWFLKKIWSRTKMNNGIAMVFCFVLFFTNDCSQGITVRDQSIRLQLFHYLLPICAIPLSSAQEQCHSSVPNTTSIC